ncbi:hypothetical protein TNCV_2432771 [Trichonephila clavipes]|nr:hypothetical protein TNCV_2432771 [Trichonephila clavipes]
MTVINHLDDFTCGRMIGKLKERCSLTAEELGINKSVVSHAWKVSQNIRTAVRKVGGGHPRKTTAVDNQYIVQVVCGAQKLDTSSMESCPLYGQESYQYHKRFSTSIDLERGWDMVSSQFHHGKRKLRWSLSCRLGKRYAKRAD